MQIYESCTGNIYIAENGYLKSIGETLIELMLEYDSKYVREIFKEICLVEKITEKQKKEINKAIKQNFRKRIETIFG